MRGTTRDPGHLAVIEAAGAQALVADPDRVVTLMPALDHVAIVCVLLGSARGERAALRALHGPRLEMLLERLIDTTARGLVYEATGSAPADVLAAGAERVRQAATRSRIPFALLSSRPEPWANWVRMAVEEIELLLERAAAA